MACIIFIASVAPASAVSGSFKRDLYFGLKKDPDVMLLQKTLKAEGCFKSTITGNFGTLTRKGVECFQKKHKFTSLSKNGYVGTYTRKILNEVLNKTRPPAVATPTLCSEYEVCQGKVLSANNINRYCEGKCELPRSFDWRNRHGENWLTSVKSQNPIGACREFSIVGTFETQVNLYYNQHINLDLSEQMYVDCQHGTSLITDFGVAKKQCEDMACNLPFCKEMFTGLVDESCSPFAGRDIFCNGLYQSTLEDKCCDLQTFCSDWKNRTWKNTGFMEYAIPPFYGYTLCQYHQLIKSDVEIKQILIEKGPLSTSIVYKYLTPGGSGLHSMVLVGYKEPNIWIFKNSWGDQDSDKGYKFIKTSDLQLFAKMSVPLGPFVPPSGQSYQIMCVDKDNDGFCNWGISKNKPSTCPASCKPEKDWDDSNPNIGALGLQTTDK